MTVRSWEEIAAELDIKLEHPDIALGMLGELVTGMFPSGLPELRRMTWEDAELREKELVLDPEARMRAAELRFRTLVEQIPAVTFMAVLGEGKNEIYVSPHIETLLGYTQEEWLSDPFLWYWRLHPDDRALWNAEFARGCRTGGPFRADCRFMNRKDEPVWVHGEARLVRDELGRPMFLQGVAFDISEMKRAQEVLVSQAVQKAKVQEELAIARRVQMSIVPRTISIPGLEVAATMVPAEDVGGDYYDVLPAADGCWIAIGDVAGHGLDAGLIMLMVQAATASLAKAKPSSTPRDVLVLLNEILFSNIRERLGGDAHVTFTLGRFKRNGMFLFTGAHEDIIVVRNDGTIEMMRPPGTWLGARPNIKTVTVDAALMLEPGEMFVLYTDGLTEARNEKREQYDIGRLCATVLRLREESCEKIRDTIMSEVNEWSPIADDDRTLVVIRYLGDGTTERVA